MKRPFDELATEEEKTAWNMQQYMEYSKPGEDGMNFTGRTSFMIAYERMLESERPENKRLFNDYLAKYFTHGDVGQKVSESMAFGLKQIFDPTDEIGLKYEGHVNYTAARTMLISDKLKAWIEQTEGKKQVLDMGSGVTTRMFWDENLKSVNLYLEVDQKAVQDSKQKILDDLKEKGILKEPMCPRKIISMDFSKESTKDLPKHGFDKDVPTCWILEGLVMYLSQETNEQMLEEMSELSAKGSYIILNFMNANPGGNSEIMDKALLANGWTKEEQLMFGDATFNYGKYPEGKPANKDMGFNFYRKL